MKLCPKRKLLLLALAVCIVFSIVSAETLIAGDVDHEYECTEYDCNACLRIETAKNFLKTLKLECIILFIAGCLVLSAEISGNHPGLNTYPLSPILLKVRLNS